MEEPIRILCVDDEAFMLSSLRRFFLDDDFEILTAASAREGLAVMRRHAPVQLILSDYRMPEENGLEFLRQVAGAWPDTVGMILSGYADLSAVSRALENREVFRFIAKPWEVAELKTAIAEALAFYRDRRSITASGPRPSA
jgi:two-component system NtrC family sensor kinase